MEKDNLSTIFNTYDPALPPDSLFRVRLEQSLRAVDLAKARFECVSRRSRLAVILSAIIGFLTGIVATLIYPHVLPLLAAFIDNALEFRVAPDVNPILASGLTIVLLTLMTAVFTLTTYDLILPSKAPDLT